MTVPDDRFSAACQEQLVAKSQASEKRVLAALSLALLSVWMHFCVKRNAKKQSNLDRKMSSNLYDVHSVSYFISHYMNIAYSLAVFLFYLSLTFISRFKRDLLSVPQYTQYTILYRNPVSHSPPPPTKLVLTHK